MGNAISGVARGVGNVFKAIVGPFIPTIPMEHKHSLPAIPENFRLDVGATVAVDPEVFRAIDGAWHQGREMVSHIGGQAQELVLVMDEATRRLMVVAREQAAEVLDDLTQCTRRIVDNVSNR